MNILFIGYQRCASPRLLLEFKDGRTSWDIFATALSTVTILKPCASYWEGFQVHIRSAQNPFCPTHDNSQAFQSCMNLPLNAMLCSAAAGFPSFPTFRSKRLNFRAFDTGGDWPRRLNSICTIYVRPLLDAIYTTYYEERKGYL